MTSVTAHPPSPLGAPDPARSSGADENHTNEITLACLASSQAEKVIVVAPLSEMREKLLTDERIVTLRYSRLWCTGTSGHSRLRRARKRTRGHRPGGAGG